MIPITLLEDAFEALAVVEVGIVMTGIVFYLLALGYSPGSSWRFTVGLGVLAALAVALVAITQESSQLPPLTYCILLFLGFAVARLRGASERDEAAPSDATDPGATSVVIELPSARSARAAVVLLMAAAIGASVVAAAFYVYSIVDGSGDRAAAFLGLVVSLGVATAVLALNVKQQR